MSAASHWYQWQGENLVLQLYIQPRSSRDEYIGPHGEDSYKVKITAPPVDGKANKHLCRFLAKSFGVPVSRVTIVSGQNSRIKRLIIKNPVNLPLPLLTTSQQ